jgi:hypothetical protein
MKGLQPLRRRSPPGKVIPHLTNAAEAPNGALLRAPYRAPQTIAEKTISRQALQRGT